MEEKLQEKSFAPQSIEARIVEVLKSCYDPEIPVDIFELGLVYDFEIDADHIAHITMTLTSPMCPVADSLPPEVEIRVGSLVEGLEGARVEVVWDPPWNPDMMSEAAKLELGMM